MDRTYGYKLRPRLERQATTKIMSQIGFLAIRGTLGLTQVQFAALLGISVNTLRNWEQGRREPEGPARVLLLVAAHRPEATLESVKSQITTSQRG